MAQKVTAPQPPHFRLPDGSVIEADQVWKLRDDAPRWYAPWLFNYEYKGYRVLSDGNVCAQGEETDGNAYGFDGQVEAQPWDLVHESVNFKTGQVAWRVAMDAMARLTSEQRRRLISAWDR